MRPRGPPQAVRAAWSVRRSIDHGRRLEAGQLESKPIVQVPEYPDQAALEAVERRPAQLPAAGFHQGGAATSRRSWPAWRAGESFLLQGGDCAESFKEHKTDYIRDYFQLFLQMALILTFAGNSAGGEDRPRRRPVRQAALLRCEKKDGQELPSYRGDIINGPDFTAEARIPDPRRQLEAYRQSAATLNFLRALLDGGYASLENAQRWELKFMEGTAVEARYDELADDIKRTVEINRAARHHHREHAGAAHDQLLHQPRGAAARLRAGADAHATS